MEWFAHLDNCLLAIQSQAKTNLPMADCLSTWLFHLYNKSGSDLSETQRTRLSKLRSQELRTELRTELAPLHRVTIIGAAYYNLAQTQSLLHSV